MRHFTVILPALIALSCTADTKQLVSPGGRDEVTVNFTIKLPASTPVSRALGEATDEYDVQQIDILAFRPDGGEFVYRSGYSAEDITGAGQQKSFTATLRTGEFDIVLLANSHSAITAASLSGMTKATALASLTAEMPTGGKWVADISAANFMPFPMWGEAGKVTVDDTTDFTGDNAVRLTRMMARVDVVIDPAVTRFKLTGVDVYNYNTKGSIVPAASGSWDEAEGKAVVPAVPASSVLTEGPISYTGDEIDGVKNRCFTEIYLFEAENHTDATHTVGKALTDRTCVVMGGIFDANDNGDFGDDGAPTYYRIDFSTGEGLSQTFLDVLRNHKYTLRVAKVSGPGCDDSWTAFTSEPHNVEVNVVQWNEAEMDDVGIEHYYFTCPKRLLRLPYAAGQTETVTISTNIPDFSFMLDGQEHMAVDGARAYISSNYSYTLTDSGVETYTLTVETLTQNTDASDERLDEWLIVTKHTNIFLWVIQESGL